MDEKNRKDDVELSDIISNLEKTMDNVKKVQDSYQDPKNISLVVEKMVEGLTSRFPGPGDYTGQIRNYVVKEIAKELDNLQGYKNFQTPYKITYEEK